MKFLTTVFALLLAHAAAAQTSPAPPIRLIMPAPAGAPPDVLGRVFAPALGAALGQQVVVENRPGAGWTIGLGELAKAAPDGRTLAWAVTGVFALGPTLFPNASYDVRSDFTPVGAVGRNPLFLVVHPSVPATTLREFVDFARGNPGKLNYSSAGNGTLPHLVMEMFKTAAAVDLVHVPYKGNHFATLVAGEVHAVFDAAMAFAPFARSGKARVLAVASDTRDRAYPTIPTAAEAGTPIDSDVWHSILAPRGLPPAVVTRLNAAIRAAVAEPEVREAFARFAVEPTATTPEAFGKLLATEIDKWTRAWKSSGAKAE